MGARILEKELKRKVVLNDDNSAPGMYDLRVGSADAPKLAVECVGEVDPAAKVQVLYQRIRDEAGQIAQSTGTTLDFTETNSIVPAPTDERLRELIDETAKGLGLTTKWMPSGAGHDAQEIARLCPVGIIFVPSVGGISHSPKEYSRSEDIANGANFLLHTLLKLDTMRLQ